MRVLHVVPTYLPAVALWRPDLFGCTRCAGLSPPRARYPCVHDTTSMVRKLECSARGAGCPRRRGRSAISLRIGPPALSLARMGRALKAEVATFDYPAPGTRFSCGPRSPRRGPRAGRACPMCSRREECSSAISSNANPAAEDRMDQYFSERANVAGAAAIHVTSELETG